MEKKKKNLKKPQRHVHNVENWHQQHLGSLFHKIPAQTPKKSISCYIWRGLTGKSLLTPQCFTGNLAEVRKNSDFFFPEKSTFKKLQQFGITAEELHKWRDCDAGEGEQLQIPPPGCGIIQKIQTHPSKCLKSSSAPGWAQLQSFGSANFLILEKKKAKVEIQNRTCPEMKGIHQGHFLLINSLLGDFLFHRFYSKQWAVTQAGFTVESIC